MEVRMWPTPSAALHNDGETPETFEARREALREKHKNGNGAGTPLTMAVKMWGTPTTRDHKDTGSLENVPENGLLGRQVSNWATPRSEMARALGNPKHITARRGNGNIEDQTAAFSLPAPETSTDGEPSSPIDPTSRRQLNPAFVEWLMGWPPGWTSFACSETALSRWRQHMRSALSARDCTPAAPPAQISLFG
jgi:hypothetical protein